MLSKLSGAWGLPYLLGGVSGISLKPSLFPSVEEEPRSLCGWEDAKTFLFCSLSIFHAEFLLPHLISLRGLESTQGHTAGPGWAERSTGRYWVAPGCGEGDKSISWNPPHFGPHWPADLQHFQCEGPWLDSIFFLLGSFSLIVFGSFPYGEVLFQFRFINDFIMKWFEISQWNMRWNSEKDMPYIEFLHYYNRVSCPCGQIFRRNIISKYVGKFALSCSCFRHFSE